MSHGESVPKRLSLGKIGVYQAHDVIVHLGLSLGHRILLFPSLDGSCLDGMLCLGWLLVEEGIDGGLYIRGVGVNGGLTLMFMLLI